MKRKMRTAIAILLVISLFATSMAGMTVSAAVPDDWDEIKASAQTVPFRTDISIPANSGQQVYKFVAPSSSVELRDIYHEEISIWDAQGESPTPIGIGFDGVHSYVYDYTNAGNTYYIVAADADYARSFQITPYYYRPVVYDPDYLAASDGASLTKGASNVSLSIPGETNSTWDIWKWEKQYQFSDASEYGWRWADHELLLIADYTAYFKNFALSNDWGGSVLDIINDTELTDNAKAIPLDASEKLSWYREYNSIGVDPAFVGGTLTVTVDIYVPAGKTIVIDRSLGVIRDSTSTAKPTPTKSQLTYSLTAKTYNGKAQGVAVTPKTGVGAVTVNYNGSTTVPKNAGTYTVTADVKAGTQYGAATDIVLGTYKINKADISKVTVAAIADKAWTGKQIKPGPASFKFNGISFTTSANATVTYGANKNIGKGTVKITGKGNFTGTKAITFKIVPKKNAVSKIAVGTKKMTVTWSRPDRTAQGITKYEVRYRVKGTTAWKPVKAYAATTSTATITGLTTGKTYDVQGRGYKTVSGVKYYSDWSATKTSVKIK